LKKVAVSLGDPNGIGLEIALKAHPILEKWGIEPLYIGTKEVVEEGAKLLGGEVPSTFQVVESGFTGNLKITPGCATGEGGEWSYRAFLKGVELAKKGEVAGVVTLPINKEAWEKGGIKFKGHTDLLRHLFGGRGIMVMGVPELLVALYTEHLPLREAVERVKREPLERFLITLAEATGFEKVGVLGLNPHAGENGVLGREEIGEIVPAIEGANRKLGREVYFGVLVPDTAFVNPPRRVVALYHDQGLAPLKALYFDRVINITYGLPIKRVSVGHGTGYDIAYRGVAKIDSYLNCFRWLFGEELGTESESEGQFPFEPKPQSRLDSHSKK